MSACSEPLLSPSASTDGLSSALPTPTNEYPRAFITDDHFKAVREAPEPPLTSLSRSPVRPRHKSTQSYTQVNYVRSQPLGMASSIHQPVQWTPRETEGNGLTRRNTVSTSESPKVGLTRSGTLPTFPSEERKSASDPLKIYGKIEDLPPNPKNWTPSQLAVYLAHVLKLTATYIIQDLISLVIKKGLTGRRFLRLRESDLRELDINPAWAKCMSEAREKLRLECLRGRILGVSSEDFQAKVDENGTLKPNSASVSRNTWKKSWRRTTGKDSRGKVKGMAQMYERPGRSERITEGSDSNWTCHSQDLSQSSSISADISSASFDEGPPRPRIIPASPSSSSDLLSDDETDNESVASTDEINIDWSSLSPIDQIQVPVDGLPSHTQELSGYEASAESHQPSPAPTYQSRIRSQPGAYSPIRGLPSEWLQSGEGEMSESRDGSTTPLALAPPAQVHDWLNPTTSKPDLAEMKSKDGSLIIVKRSQLAQLEARMSEMETMLEQLQTKEAEVEQETAKAVAPKHVARPFDDMTVTNLPGYVIMTALGVGVVAAEVLLGRVLRGR